jgi:hypothetical protein
VDLANLGSESVTCVGSHVRLVGVSISFEKNFYRLPFTPPSLVRRIGPSLNVSRVTGFPKFPNTAGEAVREAAREPSEHEEEHEDMLPVRQAGTLRRRLPGEG